jgi:hypothetical protein
MCVSRANRTASRALDTSFLQTLLLPCFFFFFTYACPMANYENRLPVAVRMVAKPHVLSGPVYFSKYFLFHPSHRIFERMHRALNVGKKTNCIVCL